MKALLRYVLFLTLLCLPLHHSLAAVIDRVVAFVDNHAITLSELEKAYDKAVKITPDITRREVLNTMVNRYVLLREAKRLRMEAPDDEKLLEDYIDLKVAAFIKVSDAEIEKFYDTNRDQFAGQALSEVREQIEAYLREKEINNRLKKHIEELKKKAYIKLLLD
jgi:hypothetical protein